MRTWPIEALALLGRRAPCPRRGLQPVPARLRTPAGGGARRRGSGPRQPAPVRSPRGGVPGGCPRRRASSIPTIGSALIELGYDRDFEEVGGTDRAGRFDPRPAPGWWRIELDPEARTVAIPIGVHVDLGATAKAFAADRAAARLAEVLGCRRAGQPGRGRRRGRRRPPGRLGHRHRRRVRHAVGRGRPGGDHRRRGAGHLGHHRPDLAPQRSDRPPHRGPVDRAGRARRLVPGVRRRTDPAWRPTPGAPPPWSGGRTPSATCPPGVCRPAWSTPTATSCSSVAGRPETALPARLPLPPATARRPPAGQEGCS